MNQSTTTKKTVAIIGGLLIIFLLVSVFIRSRGNATKNSSQAKIQQISSSSPRKDVKKNFSITMGSGKDASKLSYTIDSAQLLDEIVVNGQLVHAVAGRQFLVFDIKIRNDSSTRYQVTTRDYLRIKGKDNNEWIAPEIHNDPVEVQPISTKYTRLGFPVDEKDKSFTLQYGEISGNKATNEIHFD